MIRLVIADDQELIRRGLRTVVERETDMEVAAEAATGREALTACVNTRPDVILMDIRIPGLDGIAATRELSASPSPPRVLILTTYDLDEYVYTALRAGASGFLLKDADSAQITNAEVLLAPALTLRLVQAFIRSPLPAPTDDFHGLSPREAEVLRHMAKGSSNAEIARSMYLSEATIKSHVTSLLSKTGARDRLQAVVMAYEEGLIQRGSHPASS